MGSCTRRHFLLSTCFLQMITIIERQVFDFLGYMWAPILINFFHIIFIIFGFYGAYHFRIKYIITYLIWNFLWIGWNAFLICFYLNVGQLNRDSDYLNLGTGSVSWFEVNGYGCKPTYPVNITSDDPYRPIRPERVDECLLDYPLVEVIQSGVQCSLALLGIIGAIFISYIFLEEDDRFDFLNGDAKSPQHTVVHPMYVSYTSIPTSASATMLSNKHHPHQYQSQHPHHNHQQQQLQLQTTTTQQTELEQPNSQHPHQHPSYRPHQQSTNNNNNNNNSNSNSNGNSNSNNNNNNNSNSNNNSNTFLIHTNRSHSHNHAPHTHTHSISNNSNSNKKSSSSNSLSNSNMANASKSSTLTRMPFSPKTNKIVCSSAGAVQQQQHYYDDSTAKADQLYTHSNRRQMLVATPGGAAYQQHLAATPNSSFDNTTSSLSYASLQSSNLNLAPSLRSGYAMALAGGVSGATGGACGGDRGGAASSLSNSNYSLTSNSINNNHPISAGGGGGGGHFARIHAKPKPPKSTSYSSFINGSGVGGEVGIGGEDSAHRSDIRYTHMSSERLSSNLEEDDNFSLANFKGDDGVTYVPFKKPTPGALFVGQNNNPSYASINSYSSSPNNNTSPYNNNNNNGYLMRENSPHMLLNENAILLENGAYLEPASPASPDVQHHSKPSQRVHHHQSTPQSHPHPSQIQNPANRFMYQQNGMMPPRPMYSPTPLRSNAAHRPRPTNIPLPVIPTHSFGMPISPSDVTPPPPPAPRPHIFQPRCGQAPYPDLSPEVAEKYSMPTQYVPRSPIASRIARRQRQQQQQPERSQLANNSANFCDQIRDAPPGYIDTGVSIVRAKSHDRLASSAAAQRSDVKASKEAAPHVNRRSSGGAGRRDGRARPRSYCNSMSGGEGVIRGSIVFDRGGAGGAGGGAK